MKRDKPRRRPEPAKLTIHDIEMEEMAKRAWLERGIAILWLERIQDAWSRQLVFNLATNLYGARSAAPVPMVDQARPELADIRNDLETALGKVEAFVALLAHLADRDDDLLFFSLQYSAEFIGENVKDVFERLHAFEGKVRP